MRSFVIRSNSSDYSPGWKSGMPSGRGGHVPEFGVPFTSFFQACITLWEVGKRLCEMFWGGKGGYSLNKNISSDV